MNETLRKRIREVDEALNQKLSEAGVKIDQAVRVQISLAVVNMERHEQANTRTLRVAMTGVGNFVRTPNGEYAFVQSGQGGGRGLEGVGVVEVLEG